MQSEIEGLITAHGLDAVGIDPWGKGTVEYPYEMP